MNRTVEAIGNAYLKAQPAEFEIGDNVDVHVRIKEGDRERIQIFSGVVIGRGGRGINAGFTVRHIFQGEGVERVFPLHCPSVEKVEVKRKGKVRRAKLYYLRARSGRGSRLAERREAGEGATTTNHASQPAAGSEAKKK